MNLRLIALQGLSLHDCSNLRVLGKDFFVQKLLSDAQSLHLLQSDIEELAALLVENVVITDYNGLALRVLELQTDLLLSMTIDSDTKHIVPDADGPLKDKVHLGHLVLLIVYDTIILGRLKLSGHKAESNVEEESRVGIELNFLANAAIVRAQVEEAAEPEENILEEVHIHNLILETWRQSGQIAVIICDGREAIIGPEVREVPLDLRNECLLYWLIVRIASQKSQPVVKVADLVDVTHLLAVVCDDLYEAAHYVGEERHSAQHEENGQESLKIADWVEVSVANCGKCREGVIAAHYKLSPIRDIFELKVRHKGQFILHVIFTVQVVADHVPEAANKVGNEEGDDEEAEDPVHVHEHIYGHYSLLSPQVVKNRLDQVAEAPDVYQLEHTRQSE